VVGSLGRHLLGKLRRAHDPAPAASPIPKLGTTVDRDELVVALDNARTGGSAEADRLSFLLIEADRREDSDLGDLAIGLLASADPSLWKNLDLAARRSWWETSDWAKAARDRITHGEPSTLALVVASFHPVGYVREAAVARLGEVDDEIALRALALRAGDWVPQVRERARIALARRVSSSVESLLSVGPLAVMLADRAQGGWLFEQVEESAKSLNDLDLRRLLAAQDWRLRRAAYSVALQDGRLARDELMDAAEHDGDLVIRVQCADAAISAAVAAGTVAEVRPLIASGTAAVRAAAVSALAKAGQPDAAEAALADRNPMVREVAQAALRRAGDDPAECYRALVRATDPPDPGAVAGLGETGTSSDTMLVKPSLMDPVPRGRVEAVRALRRLGSVDVPMLVEMLTDPSAAVTRQVSTTLAPRAVEIPTEGLTLLLTERKSPHVRTAAYRLLRAQDVWTRVLTDLALYDDEDESLRARVRGDLFGWLERDAATTYSMPTAVVAERLDVLVRRAAPSLGRNRERLLRFHLGLSGEWAGPR
jgi:HEAT repeat protein